MNLSYWRSLTTWVGLISRPVHGFCLQSLKKWLNSSNTHKNNTMERRRKEVTLSEYPESRGMQEGSWASSSQDLVFGCWNITSLQGRTGVTGNWSSPSLSILSVPAQQQSTHSINLNKSKKIYIGVKEKHECMDSLWFTRTFDHHSVSRERNNPILWDPRAVLVSPWGFERCSS